MTQDPILRVNTRVNLARVYIADRKIGMTWEQLDRAFSELGYTQSRNKIFQIAKTLLYWFQAQVIVYLPFRRKNASELSRLKMLVQCYEVAMQAAYFKTDPAFLLYGIQSLRPAAGIGVSRELSFAYSLYGLNFALLKFSKTARKYGLKAIRVAEKTGDRLAIVRAMVWFAIQNNVDGKWEESASMMKSLMEEDSWIDVTDYLNLCGCLMFQAICDGQAEVCLDTVGRGIRRLSRSQAQVGVKDSIKYHPYFSYQMLSLALIGQGKKAAEFIKHCKEQMRLTPEDKFGGGLFFSCLTGFCYETGEFGKTAEDAIRGYKDVDRNAPFLSTIHTKHFYVFQAYIRIEQYLRRPSERSKYLDLLKLAVKELRSATLIPDCPALKAHQKVIESALTYFQSKTEKAMRMLDEAENAARASNTPLARFEAIRLRARILKSQGKVRAASQEAQLAYDLANDFGWLSRTSRIMNEFEIRPLQALLRSQSAGSDEKHSTSDLRQRRYEGALLRIGLAAGSKIDPTEQARSALDELNKALGAERAFMFEFNEESGMLSLLLGRGVKEDDLSEPDGYSRTVIEMVIKTKKSLILTADEFGEMVSSDSIISQNIKSIMAAPMLLEDHLEGIIYLDNRLVKGVFTQEDMQLLQSIANQIAVARKSARTAVSIFEKKQMRANLVRFLPSNVVREIMSGTLQIDQGPRHLAVTVLFSDLVDFTKVLGSISASDGATILNKYLDRMINVIFEHGGTIDKFIGDAIMVIFGAPLEIPPHEQVQKAIACASAMQTALNELNQEWQKELKIGEIRMRIGVHHGPVLIGHFGNEHRMQYTAFGNTVNLASRIQSSCEPGKVFFSQVVCDYLSNINLRKVGSFDLKGIEGSINLYALT